MTKRGYRELISGIWIWDYYIEEYVFPNNYTGCILLKIEGVMKKSWNEIERLLLRYKREKFFWEYAGRKGIQIKSYQDLQKKRSQLVKQLSEN